MTRTGKIARLPRNVREELNRRLGDGEEGKRLVAWLNSRPEVQSILALDFGGRPINEQNLSEWKHGGFEDCLRHEEARTWVQHLVESSGRLEKEAGDCSVSDRLSAPLAVALGRCLQAITETKSDANALRLLLGVAREVSMLRRGDHSSRRLRLEQERWQAEHEAKRNAAYANLQAAMERVGRQVSSLREEYEEKKQAGTLSAEAQALCEDVFVEYEDICR
jgi:hypothetical protein